MSPPKSHWRKLFSEAFNNLFPAIPYAAPESRESGDWAVEVKNLAVQIKSQNLPVFSNVSFEIPVHCRTALIGPNGSGKSTLLKTLAGLIPQYAGEIKLFGSEPRLGRSRIAYLAQSPQLNPDFPLQLKRLVQMGTYAHHGWFEECHHSDEKVASTLKLLELEDLVDRPVHNLSGGQLQRGLLARAAVQGAEILLLDEPYAALDTKSREIVENFLFHKDNSFTVIMATHEAADSQKFDRVLEICDGCLKTTHACAGHKNHHA
ncbi:MAG: ABC transporter [Opitutia bacterium]|nr:ATP-binding cassette domain-containing protein [Opitutales bacterium]PHX68776.1 MAG: ABC transporter [Opitutae bacterium]